MLLIPAIDLKDGQCVRLRQGDLKDATIFSDDPLTVANNWFDQGAPRLHLVDLNGAVAGKPKNLSVIKQIVKSVGYDIPIQIGGGIRDMETIELYLDNGIEYVIIGTAAVKDPGFLQDACSAFAGHIIVGLDAKEGRVATDGWSKLTKHDVIDLAKKYQDFGVESIIYTDIGRDGMLSGVNLEATVKLAQAVNIPIIASGGVTDLSDIEKLCQVEQEGIEGVILGRSIYEGTIDFQDALDLADELSEEAE
ncbi:1-(5-phosphoribosyl)-5-[(5-phosphoribosylamino)methylideneamino]imidazole-4-carboxamide isomerase [Brackiella oedipodis]|uniref:1-(5-phosphoribosyl)-5-[(5- phosphoribosylamino)methylideneamino]imidazole-4- carboxamide isomerase n=1 Tax=Brackiella oedipodis TaxID=124225 RepID=UPI00048E5BD4|nr:1-(5-phosphoribosyl)-5-[(5-phosphoribosylamino)methylideneamino]imidazole-4-carboxamide isomerase [Brackiella oedipodis]